MSIKLPKFMALIKSDYKGKVVLFLDFIQPFSNVVSESHIVVKKCCQPNSMRAHGTFIGMSLALDLWPTRFGLRAT